MKGSELFYPEGHVFQSEEERLIALEELVLNVTEDILVAMEDKGVTKQKLAKKLGKSKSYISQVLGGARNMTLKTLSDMCFALEITPKISLCDKECNSIFFKKEEPTFIRSENNNEWEFISLDEFCEPETSCFDNYTFRSNVIDKRDKNYWYKAA